MTTNEYIRGVKNEGWPPFPGKVWQRNYYEHIIRSERALNAIRIYIENNPRIWCLDQENPHAARSAASARHYGFTAEELDFLLNYDVKYRMGKGAEEEAE